MTEGGEWEGRVAQWRPEINIFRLQTRRFTDSPARSQLPGDLTQVFPEQEVSGSRQEGPGVMQPGLSREQPFTHARTFWTIGEKPGTGRCF